MEEIVQCVKCKIDYNSISQKFILIFENAFTKYQLYFPDWIREIKLEQDPDVENIQITQSRAHRWITITVNPKWDGNEMDVLHEIAHTYSTNMWLYFLETVLDLLSDDIREMIRLQFVREMEEDVQNLAFLMEKLNEQSGIAKQAIPAKHASIQDIEF